MFRFVDIGDLISKRGPFGKWIFYSPSDYFVEKHRQLYEGVV